MPYTCFISDLHLDPARPDISRAFSWFLDQHTGCDALYILGDLFEAWVGDDDCTPLARDTRAALSAFTRAGPKLHILTGNRDFLLGERFCTDTGACLLGETEVIDLYGQPTLVMHGDTLCTDDRDYLILREHLRDARWQADFLALPLPERQAQAKALRNLSREAVSAKAEAIMDVNAAAVTAALHDHGVTRLIHGHTHRPGHHAATPGERWVLGDWDSRGWWLAAAPTDMVLKSFIIQ